jgi:hypothetical protein
MDVLDEADTAGEDVAGESAGSSYLVTSAHVRVLLTDDRLRSHERADSHFSPPTASLDPIAPGSSEPDCCDSR